MQRQFTLEIRVDYADHEKNAMMQKIMAQAARHVYSNASLLADNGVKPQIAIFSDDMFSGHEEIKMLDDVIAEGRQIVGADDADEGISSELLAAATEKGA